MNASQFHCDVCGQDCSNRVRVSCAECSEYDLCVPCFSSGASSGDHKPYHDYRIIEQPVFPIFSEDWGADEELLLIEGAQTCGLGNWSDIAKHIGGRSKDEVKQHYFKYYLDSPTYPIPDMNKDFSHVTPEAFAQRRKKRLEERLNAPLPPPIPKPPASVPLCHEVHGYMPGRLEFEQEYENDAEVSVKDMVFDLKEDKPEDVNLKLTILEIYDARLSARAERKRLMLKYKLLDYKKNMEQEKKKRRLKEEKEVHNKLKAYTRIMTPKNFSEFSEDLLTEFSLRNRIAQLQSWRNAGLTTIESGIKYEKDKVVGANQLQRAANTAGTRHSRTSSYSASTIPAVSDRYFSDLVANSSNNGSLTSLSSIGAAANNNNNNSTSVSGGDAGNGAAAGAAGALSKNKKNTPAPLDISHAPDFELLSPEEQKMCSQLRIRPKPYLAIKETLFRELIRSGGVLKKRTARELLKIDVNKTSKIYEFFVQQNWIQQT